MEMKWLKKKVGNIALYISVGNQPHNDLFEGPEPKAGFAFLSFLLKDLRFEGGNAFNLLIQKGIFDNFRLYCTVPFKT